MSWSPLQNRSAGLLQRKCACGGEAGMSGQCEECSQKKRLGLQTKLKISEPGDSYEQEADRVADQVIAASAHRGVSGAPPRIQRFLGQSNGQIHAAPASVDHALASPSRPLEPALRQDMEQRFGHDFSKVRVHAHGAAGQSAQSVNARAYTLGDHVVFGAGHYAPETSDGRRLLAHELTHVLQQQRHSTPWIQRAPAVSDPTAATNVASGNRYNLELLVPKQYLQNARTYSYPNQTDTEAINVLLKFRERLMDIIDIHRGLHRELRDNREKHSTVGFWADTFGRVSLPDYEMWETPKGTLFEVRLLLDALRRGLRNPENVRRYFIEQTIAGTWRGGFDPGADALTQVTVFLQVAANQIGECVTRLVKYKEGTEHGAEFGVTVCKVSIVVLSSVVGGEAFNAARTAGYGLVSSSLAASGAGVITTEASEIGGQIGEMRYGDRKWGDFDYERIAKVGAKSAVTGFIGAIVGGKLSELAGAGFAKFAGPLMNRLGFNLNAAGIKWLGGLGQTWLAGAGSAPFTTAADVVIDKAMGDRTVDNWGDFFNLVLHNMKTNVELGTFLHVVGGIIQARGGTTEPPSARPAGGNGSGEGGGGTGGGGGGGGGGQRVTEPVDPYARTEQIPAQTPRVQRGNAPIGSARTLRPGELEAQTSPTQPHSTVEPPVDPHARTVEITPDTSGPQRGNAAPGNARTLRPGELEAQTSPTQPHSTVEPPVDPHARTVEITPDTSGPQRGNAAPGNARTLRPGELEAQTSPTQPHSTVEPPVDPHARTVEITPDTSGPQRGNAAPGNARTLRPGELEAQTSPTQPHSTVEPPVDPHARTVEITPDTSGPQRGNAAPGNARTLRPGELEAQTSPTQPHSTVEPPVDPHARTVEITPDTSGPQRGNAAPGNARTLTLEEVAREQADTAPMSAETPQTADAGPPPIPVAEPPAPLAPGPIHDPVAASQALARASRNGTSFRLIPDPESVRISWEGEGHPGEAPPPAWVDDTGKLTVDTTRIRAPLRSSDVLAGPIYEAPAAAEPTPSGQTEESIPPERTNAADARESAMPPPIAVGHSAPPEVTASIRDPQAAQALYWQQHSEFMRGETEDPASFTTDRAIYDANWKLARGEGDSPPAWRDQYDRLNVDATRVDIHQPPTELIFC